MTPEYDLQIKTAQEQEKQAKIFLWVCSILIIFCVISSGIFLLQTQKVTLDYAAYQSANSSGSSSGSSFGGGGASGGW